MNWSIFKLTTYKIVWTVVLFVLLVPFIYYDTGIRCIQAPCPSLALGTVAEYLFSSYDFYFPVGEIQYLYAIAGLLAAYLISCLLAFLLHRKNNA